MAATPLENSNLLMFFDKNQWRDELSRTEASPYVVLLSSWEHDESSFQQMQPLITKLINLGCKYFVCAGKHSEPLHDFIDDVVLDMSLSSKPENTNNIITTWHDVDTDDEVADFFLHSTNASNSLLVAFLDEGKLGDSRLKKAILNRVGSDQ
jgi:hypothetical protein